MNITVEELNNFSNLPPENRAKFLELKAEEEQEKAIKQREKKSPFANWLQVNNAEDFYKAESWLIRNSPIAYQVLRFLAKEMDNYNAIICSFKVMEEALGYKRNALSKAVSLLKKHKYLDVKKSGTANVYLINKELYWKSWGTNYRYAEFGAKIIIAESEQEETKIESKKYKTAVVTPKGKIKTTKNTVLDSSKSTTNHEETPTQEKVPAKAEMPENEPVSENFEILLKTDLPQLIGTEKQIWWAEQIRLNFFNELTFENMTKKIVEIFKTKTESKFWIENREKKVDELEKTL